MGGMLELAGSSANLAAGLAGSSADQGCPVVHGAAVLQLAAAQFACFLRQHSHHMTSLT